MLTSACQSYSSREVEIETIFKNRILNTGMHLINAYGKTCVVQN